jgi:hypothetical protein
MFGFPGLRLTADALSFSSPTLVPGAASLKLRGLRWRGASFDVGYGTLPTGGGELRVELVSSPSSRPSSPPVSMPAAAVPATAATTSTSAAAKADGVGAFVVTYDGGTAVASLEVGIPLTLAYGPGTAFSIAFSAQ